MNSSAISTDRLHRARGAWLGQITGDALGTTLEFMSKRRIREGYPNGLRDIVGGGPFRVLPGQVTDDTELALALARSLKRYGPDFDAIARAYTSWLRSGPFDIGSTTQQALRSSASLESITELSLSSRASLTSQANGSLMRISPLAIFGHELPPEELGNLARRDSRLTHPHPACQEACAAYSRAIAALIRGASAVEAWLEALRSAFNEQGRESGILASLMAAEQEPPICDGETIGWVRVALQNAFYHLLNSDSFEDALVETVGAGGDTDTNACIAGALLGASFGESQIPARWRETVLACQTPRGPDYQCHDALELAESLLKIGHDFKQRPQQGLLPFPKLEPSEAPPQGEYADDLAFLSDLVQEAGQRLIDEAERDGGPRGSGDKAEVDIEIERFLREAIRERYPDDGIIGEELGAEPGRSERSFLIDPHDGTRDFLKGARTTSVSLALISRGQFLLSIVYCPFPGPLTGPEGVFATWTLGDRLRLNGRAVQPGSRPTLLDEKSLVLVSTRVHGEDWDRNHACVAPAELACCASIATRLTLVAVGRAQAALTVGHKLADWDFAGAQALLMASGGELVDQTGHRILWQGDRSISARARAYFGAASPSIARTLAARYCGAFSLDR